MKLRLLELEETKVSYDGRFSVDEKDEIDLTELHNRLKEKGLDATYEPELASAQVILRKSGITINFYSNGSIQVHSRNCDRLMDHNIILEIFEKVK